MIISGAVIGGAQLPHHATKCVHVIFSVIGRVLTTAHYYVIIPVDGSTFLSDKTRKKTRKNTEKGKEILG